MDFKDKDIIVTEYSYKKELLKKLSKAPSFLDVKIYTKKEFLNKYYFSYNEDALYYIISKYNVNEDIARTYLDNLYYIDNKHYESDKLNNLVSLKNELIDNDLLIFDDLFKESLKNKTIHFYNYNYFNKLELDMIDKLKSIATVNIIEKEYKEYKKEVYEFSNIFEEVEFVCISILKLLEEGVSLNNIKLAGITDEYIDIVDFIFSLHGLKTDINESYLISNSIALDFLNTKGSLEDKISFITDKYKENDITDKIINICNKYVLYYDINIVNKLIENDFKNTKISKEKYDNVIETIDFMNYPYCDDYIFLLGFNTNIPKVYKDEDYITDNLKEELLLDNTNEKNKKEKEATIKNINSIKNLTISYKNSTSFDTCYPSNLISDLNMTVIKDFKYDEIYSIDYASIILAKELDNFALYNEKSDTLKKYYSTIDTKYNTYDNTFKGIDNNSLLDYLKDGFNLSYSSMDNYYKCAFRYYLANVLKLDIYEDTFEAYIGSLFHYVLENGLKSKIIIEEEVEKFIEKEKRSLTDKERFFIDNLIPDIKFALDTIKDNMNYTDLKDLLFEQKVEVVKNKNVTVTFKGFIDKIMYKDYGDNTIVVIVDYKTGNTDIKLENTPFGLSMQLPIYLYLTKHLDKLHNIRFGGFYLQKVLPKKLTNNESDKDIRLTGYSNSDINVLEKVDHTYEKSTMIKGMKLNQNGSFSSHAKVLSDSDFKFLIDLADEKIEKAIDSITKGEFYINPKVTDKDNLGCSYCKFKDICFKTSKDEVKINPSKDLSFLGGDINA